MNLYDMRNQPAVSVSYETARPLIKWTYAWMLIGLLVTSAVAWFTASSPALVEIRATPGIAIGIFVVQILLVVVLSWAINRISPSLAAILFMVYAATVGFSLSLVLLAFSLGSVAAAFLTTAILFGVMSVFGFTTDTDLTKFRNLFMFALFGIIIALVVNMFLGSSMLNFIISVLGVLIFMGLTAYDTQNLKKMAASVELQGDQALMAKMSIFGALSLYLNFINIFIFLLQIMGGNRD